MKITDHNHDKYITIPEFNRLTKETFNARLKQANLVNKTDFDDKLKYLNKKLIQLKQNIYLLKINLKNYKHLIQVFFLVKATLILMEHNFQSIHKTITTFSGLTNITSE